MVGHGAESLRTPPENSCHGDVAEGQHRYRNDEQNQKLVPAEHVLERRRQKVVAGADEGSYRGYIVVEEMGLEVLMMRMMATTVMMRLMMIIVVMMIMMATMIILMMLMMMVVVAMKTAIILDY